MEQDFSNPLQLNGALFQEYIVTQRKTGIILKL